MAHFAEIDENGVVLRVLVVNDAHEHDGANYLANEMNLGGNWIKTSYNTQGGVHLAGGTPFRKNYAGTGYTYDEIRDAFIPPKTYPSWILDENSCTWKSPVPMPEDGQSYKWNEETVSWELYS